MPRLVVKYGGNTISSPARMRAVSRQLADISRQYQTVVVCSAMGTTTDDLVRISELTRTGDRQGVSELVRKVTDMHHAAARGLVDDPAILERLLSSLNAIFEQLRSLIDGLLILGEETPRSRDYLLSFGERFAVEMLTAALRDVRDGRRGADRQGCRNPDPTRGSAGRDH